MIGFGYVGSTLSILLLKNKHSIALNIMEPDKNCEGAILDMAHGMYLLGENELYHNDRDLLEQADFVFYAAGIANEHGSSRLSITQDNIKLSKSIFEGINFRNSPYVIVITNPVDIISNTVKRFSNLPSSRVIGIGTFLDSLRLSYYLSELSNFHLTDFETMVCGEHGDSQVAIFSHSTLKGLPIIGHDSIDTNLLEQAVFKTKNAANQIRQTQEGTTYGVSICAEFLFNYLIDGGTYQLSLSVQTDEYYRELLQLKEDLYLGLPVIINSGEIELNRNITFSKDELMRMRNSAEIIEKYKA